MGEERRGGSDDGRADGVDVDADGGRGNYALGAKLPPPRRRKKQTAAAAANARIESEAEGQRERGKSDKDLASPSFHRPRPRRLGDLFVRPRWAHVVDISGQRQSEKENEGPVKQ